MNSSFKIIPADNVTARYYRFPGTLILTAKGTTSTFSYDYQFNRQLAVGGLWYKLQAWTTPIQVMTPYVWEESFFIPNIQEVAPGNKVIVITANNPRREVPIEWVDFEEATDGTTSASEKISMQMTASSKAEITPDSDIVLPPEPVIVSWPEKFTIKTAVPTDWTVRPQYDWTFLSLVSSGVDRGMVWWEFQPLQIGRTQVLVYGNGWTQAIQILRDYDVHIVVPVISDGSSDVPKQSPDIYCNFPEKLNSAQDIVQKEYPDAKLIYAKASLPTGGPIYPVDNPLLLSETMAIFNVSGGIVTIRSIGGCVFRKPEFSKGRRLGLQPINIEEDLKYDLQEAHKVMLGQGITMSFFDVELKKVGPVKIPEIPDCSLYYWSMLDGSIIMTSTVTGVVYDGRNGEVGG